VKGDISIGEQPVFVGECHFKFFKAGAILDIMSLKKEKPPSSVLQSGAVAGCVFSRQVGALLFVPIIIIGMLIV
jgi:hypothetical protein